MVSSWLPTYPNWAVTELPATVYVIIEVPKGSFLKRELHQGTRIEFISPVPCPFNYGHVPTLLGQDGDPVDAVVLGPRLSLGVRVEVPVQAVVRFYDAGLPDDKLVCAPAPLTGRQKFLIGGFFRTYVHARRLLNRAQGRNGETVFTGLVTRDQFKPFKNRR
jgi:inorganic pyrophosphatase